MSILEVAQGMQHQTTNEEIVYTITTTNWASTPLTPTVAVYNETLNNVDVTSSVGTPTATSAADLITLTALKTLTKGHTYRVEVKFVVGSNTWETYFRVYCEV